MASQAEARLHIKKEHSSKKQKGEKLNFQKFLIYEEFNSATWQILSFLAFCSNLEKKGEKGGKCACFQVKLNGEQKMGEADESNKESIKMLNEMIGFHFVILFFETREAILVIVDPQGSFGWQYVIPR